MPARLLPRVKHKGETCNEVEPERGVCITRGLSTLNIAYQTVRNLDTDVGFGSDGMVRVQEE